MIQIFNSIWEVFAGETGPEYNEVTHGDNLDTALDTALAADVLSWPNFIYGENIITPFGTDERQCESDAIIAKFRAEQELLPF